MSPTFNRKSFCTQHSCPQGHQTIYMCYCPACKCEITSSDKKHFSDGMNLCCPNLDCKFQFQLLNCPNPDCGKVLLFQKHSMGSIAECHHCYTRFEQVACIHCGASNYWKGTHDHFYKPGYPTTCYKCKNTFQHINCPHCKSYMYFPDCNYIQGSKQNCRSCGNSFQHVSCLCTQASYYPNCAFKYGMPYSCQNTECSYCLILLICPNCKKENYEEKQNSEQGLAERKCKHCQVNYAYLTCEKCSNPTYILTEQIAKRYILTCDECSIAKPILNCPDCGLITIGAGTCQTLTCIMKTHNSSAPQGSGASTDKADQTSNKQNHSSSKKVNFMGNPQAIAESLIKIIRELNINGKYSDAIEWGVTYIGELSFSSELHYELARVYIKMKMMYISI